jgi:FkbM family methyltransferase
VTAIEATSAAGGARNALGRSAALRRVVKSRPAQHLIQTARGAHAVRESRLFTLRQFGGRRVAGYTLRESAHRVHLRHGARDVAVLNEIFGGTAGRNCYEPPAPVADVLDALPTLRVLDVGANIGLFSMFALERWPAGTVIGLEPDPGNFELLSLTVGDNGFGGRWQIERLAAFTAPGRVPFAAGLFSDAHIAEEGGADTIDVPAVDFFEQARGIDLVKMDIEGGEWPILTDPRLGELEAAVFVLEWHSRGCPGPDPYGAVLNLLAAAGYTRTHEVENHGESGVLWAWR